MNIDSSNLFNPYPTDNKRKLENTNEDFNKKKMNKIAKKNIPSLVSKPPSAKNKNTKKNENNHDTKEGARKTSIINLRRSMRGGLPVGIHQLILKKLPHEDLRSLAKINAESEDAVKKRFLEDFEKNVADPTSIGFHDIKKFNEFMGPQYAKRTTYGVILQDQFTIDSVKNYLLDHPHVDSILLDRCDLTAKEGEEKKSIFESFLETFSNKLTSLQIGYCKMNDENIKQLIKSCKASEKERQINETSISSNDNDSKREEIKILKKLYLDNLNSSEVIDLNLLKDLPLTALEITDFPKKIDHTTFPESLVSLVLTDCEIGDHVTLGEQLDKLHLTNIMKNPTEVQDYKLNFLKNVTAPLQELKIQNFEFTSLTLPKNISGQCLLINLRKLTNIENLNKLYFLKSIQIDTCNLKKLELPENLLRFSFNGLFNLTSINCHTKIEHIVITDCYLLEDYSFKSLVNLKTLALNSVFIDKKNKTRSTKPFDISILDRCSKLEDLSLGNKLTTKNANALEKIFNNNYTLKIYSSSKNPLLNVKTLEMHNTVFEEINDISLETENKCAKFFPNIQELLISNMPKQINEKDVEILDGLQNLHFLTIENSQVNLGENLAKLEIVTLKDCPKIKNFFVPASVLNLHVDKSLIALQSHLEAPPFSSPTTSSSVRDRNTLKFSTSKTLKSFKTTNFSLPKSVEINKNDFNNSYIDSLFNKQINITAFILSECELNQENFEYLINKFPNIDHLLLKGCTIDDHILTSLGKLKKLKILKLESPLPKNASMLFLNELKELRSLALVPPVVPPNNLDFKGINPLKNLEVFLQTNVDLENFEFKKNMPHLINLAVVDCLLLQPVTGLEKLNILVIKNSIPNRANNEPIIGDLPNLESLMVANCPFIKVMDIPGNAKQIKLNNIVFTHQKK